MAADAASSASELLDRRGRPRCVVTGVGVVTADGIGADEVWASWTRRQDAPVVGDVRDFPARRWLDRKEASRSAPFVHYAIAAADEALAEAGLAELDPRRTGIVTSTIYGTPATIEAQRAAFDREGADGVDAYYGAMACENAAAAALAMHHGIRGPAKSVLGACAGGGFAIADATELIRSGRCDVVLAGASQEMVTPAMRAAYVNLRVLAEDGWCRPFDRRRGGFAFGAGAGFLVLERAEHARDRRARPVAEVLGWANTNDASSLVRPNGTGAIECLADAIDDASLTPGDIVAVNAHGTGTALNDEVEAQALNEVLGTPGPPVTSIKGVSGHLAGAAGAVEAVATILAMRHRAIPPVAVDLEADPAIHLDLVAGGPRPWEPGPTISNSFGLGGHNCCLVIGPYPAAVGASPGGR